MKFVLKVFIASFLAGSWYVLTENKEISVIFFLIILFALLFNPFRSKSPAIRDQYIEKLKENIRKNQEVHEQFFKEKNVTYKDFRKKERR